MCKCNKGMRNANGSQINPLATGDRVVAIYNNPSQLETIRIFDQVDNPTRYLGLARHGYPVSVPRSLLNVPRSDGSMFVLPEDFTPDMPQFAVSEKVATKPKRVKVVR
jgi:hypothetical protein